MSPRQSNDPIDREVQRRSRAHAEQFFGGVCVGFIMACAVLTTLLGGGC